MPSLYPQAKGILNAFKDKEIDMAIASRSPTPDITNTFLDKLNIKPMFVAKLRIALLLFYRKSFQVGHTKHNIFRKFIRGSGCPLIRCSFSTMRIGIYKR
ncbi:hypothetical protein Tsubulata_013995 [Turnera subulata]|uniref:Uncharacterized protein n=1 Tax=Turnera subulata TaxID=218843 RepID=A0A9Q0G2C4_9ROSI|nr:hypothetical protein Tsubulata_013995 [Turnera subulata]